MPSYQESPKQPQRVCTVASKPSHSNVNKTSTQQVLWPDCRPPKSGVTGDQPAHPTLDDLPPHQDAPSGVQSIVTEQFRSGYGHFLSYISLIDLNGESGVTLNSRVGRRSGKAAVPSAPASRH